MSASFFLIIVTNGNYDEADFFVIGNPLRLHTGAQSNERRAGGLYGDTPDDRVGGGQVKVQYIRLGF